ncbi:TPA: hypothetical protein ROY01_001039 [Bacillus toyonensis]|nr:hypothetical protein [Bacillus toyonensis]
MESKYKSTICLLPPSRKKYNASRFSIYDAAQRIASLESQLAKLISLIEENNQLIKSMEQQQNQVCAPAGGSVIVRM